MEFLYWCSHPLSPCFDNYPDYRNMSVVPRETIVRGTHPTVRVDIFMVVFIS